MSDVNNCQPACGCSSTTTTPVQAPKPAANNPAPVTPDQKAQGVPQKNPRRQMRKQH